MKRILIILLLVIPAISLAQLTSNQRNDAWKTNYRATATKINDLVNTKLDVSFDFSKSWMYGKAWVTLKPHFYPTDSLTLDAKNMEIREVSILKEGKTNQLKYTYDSQKLHIILDKTYKSGETYTVFIDYISKPNEVIQKGSAAISSAKGLYFINPLGKDKNKPTQVWTQGETESNSAWVPTIDKPNQKTTDEISITVPDKFVTLSNGLMVKQKKHSDGTRTDTWKMDLPHAPYLMMMAVGEYAIIKDKYKNKEVSYYVEKQYAPVARKIFGLTPEMISFYSRITGVDFPWQKYAQIAVRDYVSGAMENTTATVHGESAQQDARQLVDGNQSEDVISHELFHMWFGDYVTTESWSNLSMNESFADLSETLWQEYKHGKDAGDEHNYQSMQNYLYSNSASKDLVRFYYRDREDMFDMVSYQKGGRILYMLRNYVGEEAFYKSLNLYLTSHKYGTAEAQDLRLAFEEVTGQDLNWYWNQWFYGNGHPVLNINYDYNKDKQTSMVIVNQTQANKIFRLPVAIDVYQGGSKTRYNVWLNSKADTITFPVTTRPDLINVDGDRVLLCQRTDNKTMDNYIFQYSKAGLYVDRMEAIQYAGKHIKDDPGAIGFLKTVSVNDKFEPLRIMALQLLSNQDDNIRKSLEPLYKGIAEGQNSPRLRALAIFGLGSYKNAAYKDLFLKNLYDSSYTVAGNSLNALVLIDSTMAISIARELSATPVKGTLSRSITNILYTYASEDDFSVLADKFNNLSAGNSKFNLLQPFAGYLKKLKNTENFKKGIDMLVAFRDELAQRSQGQMNSYFNNYILKDIVTAKEKAGLTEQAEYVKSKINTPEKANGNQ
jgi:aminopeptidase N